MYTTNLICATIYPEGGQNLMIGDRIKRLRKELGLSADELGKIIGKDRSTIYRYENGDIEKATIDVIPPLAKALKTTPQYLMGWDEKPAFSWIDPAYRMKLSDLAEKSLSWTFSYTWTAEEFELFAAHARYVLRIKDTDEYETMMQFLATFYEQLNK
jgi:transcriptional regulator with XRE-family HTH domain